MRAYLMRTIYDCARIIRYTECALDGLRREKAYLLKCGGGHRDVFFFFMVVVKHYIHPYRQGRLRATFSRTIKIDDRSS